MTDGMTVALPALKRAWRAGGEESLWIRVQTKTPWRSLSPPPRPP